MSMNEDKLNRLLERVVLDFGATWHAPLVVIGDRLGLYRALADGGPLTSSELAENTGTRERYVREWLRAQSAGGYVDYDPESDRYAMSAEQAAVLVDEDSPTFLVGAFQGAVAGIKAAPRVEKAFREGGGVGWHEHDHELFHATERMFRPGYLDNLVAKWIPALDGVSDKLAAGARVADIGCGYGASTIIMARAFPESEFVGFDYHDESIRTAAERAEAAGVGDRVRFEKAGAKDFNGGGYHLIAAFDCLHDMGDPAGVAAHVREQLDEDGTWMIVEPYAGDRVQDNLNPVGRAFYSVSTLVCTPCSLSQEVARGLGAQAGEARLREVIAEGGFRHFRRAAETPFNMVLEARP
jgi:2-polyprenyl-3-methyl-5-hydroxy-6-metoxy-1,4-benzoquinol methylase